MESFPELKIQVCVNNSSTKHSFLLFFIVNSFSKTTLENWELSTTRSPHEGSDKESPGLGCYYFNTIFCKSHSATVRPLILDAWTIPTPTVSIPRITSYSPQKNEVFHINFNFRTLLVRLLYKVISEKHSDSGLLPTSTKCNLPYDFSYFPGC